MLCKVMKAHAVADGPRALVWRQDAGQHLQKRALAGAVFTDERDPLTALHGKIQGRVDDFFAVPLAYALEVQYMATARGGQGEFKLHPLGVTLQLDQFDFLELLDP